MSVKRWLDRWKETKDFSDSSRLGPPRSTTPVEDQLMVDLTTEEMDATSETVKQERRSLSAMEQFDDDSMMLASNT